MTGKILPDDPRPPSKGDKLFVPGLHRHHSAYLAIPASNWDAYAMAYGLAADLLAGHVGDNILHSSLLGFPVLFLYRQYLELRIKELRGAVAEFLGHEYTLSRDHNLLNLWQGVRPTLDELCSESVDQLDAVEEKLREFSTVDPLSYTFRYPVDTNGEPTLRTYRRGVQVGPDGQPVDRELAGPPSPWSIDVPHLREIMEGVAAVLDGCSAAIHAAQEAKWDQWAEMEGEFREV